MIVKVDGVVVYRNTQIGVQGPPGVPGPAGADGAPGPAGADGSNVVWRGAWDALTAYQVLDGAQHHGSAWVATEGVQAGDEPGVAASWELWVSKGDPGTPGEPGAPGTDGADGQDGSDGREVELQKSATHIQWRYEGDPTWTDLVALIDLEGPQGPAGSDGADGREVELQVTGTHIQWRLTGGSWQNLIALSELEGPQGPKGAPGEAGAPGVGVPAGGAAGQVLAKASSADYDTEWVTGGGGGGAAAFTDLTDTPSDYTGHAGKTVVVKEDETGLEFANAGGGDGVPATGFTAMVALEQAEYDLLDPPDPDTLYFVLEATP